MIWEFKGEVVKHPRDLSHEGPEGSGAQWILHLIGLTLACVSTGAEGGTSSLASAAMPPHATTAWMHRGSENRLLRGV